MLEQMSFYCCSQPVLAATTKMTPPEQTNLPNDHGGPWPEGTSWSTMASDTLAISWGYVSLLTINQSVKKRKEKIRY